MYGRKKTSLLTHLSVELQSCESQTVKQTNTTKTKQKVWNHFCSTFDANPRKLRTKPARQVLSKFLLFISLPGLQTAPPTSKLFSFFQEGREGNTPTSPSQWWQCALKWSKGLFEGSESGLVNKPQGEEPGEHEPPVFLALWGSLWELVRWDELQGFGYHGPFNGRLNLSDSSGKMLMIRLSDESSNTSKVSCHLKTKSGNIWLLPQKMFLLSWTCAASEGSVFQDTKTWTRKEVTSCIQPSHLRVWRLSWGICWTFMGLTPGINLLCG